ncbi:MAG: flagellar basal body-associated FliL family protein [Deltaproteobacteria bacterium]|jgi:flagellar FliL protein|nr:flagellar basal body-associated FliL family protein [Deltaproteobacteria bacterium]
MADDDTPKKKGGKLKWILLLLFLLLLLGGGGAGAWYFFFSDLPGSRNATAGGDAPKEAVKTSAPQNLQTTVLDSFLVNLADPLGKRYIKVTFEVEVVNSDVTEELTRQKPKVRDSIIMLLSSKTYADLAPAESKLALKTEVAQRLNQILGGPKVTRVFITEMVIQ